MELRIDPNQFQQLLEQFEERATQAAELALQDCADDLERTASENTPIDTGALTRSSTQTKRRQGDVLKIDVEFSIRNNGFNYAILMHEGTYNLGVQSSQRPGGVGMSGRRYQVGRKYLAQVINGEGQAYTEHIARMIRNATGV